MTVFARLSGWPLALLAACAVNALVFLGIPLLSGKVSAPPVLPDMGGVFLARVEPPPPPERAVPDEPVLRPRVARRPDVDPAPAATRPPQAPPMPELRLRLPGDISLDVALPALAPPQPSAFKAEYGLAEVDTAPVAVRRDAPAYPVSARRRGVEGVVTVRFLVGEDGAPRNISVENSEPAGVFDANVLRAVKRWRFRPGMVDGHAVATWMRLPVRFRLGGR